MLKWYCRLVSFSLLTTHCALQTTEKIFSWVDCQPESLSSLYPKYLNKRPPNKSPPYLNVKNFYILKSGKIYINFRFFTRTLKFFENDFGQTILIYFQRWFCFFFFFENLQKTPKIIIFLQIFSKKKFLNKSPPPVKMSSFFDV